MPLFLGLDTGGTYTDAVLFDPAKGVLAAAKSLTTKHDLAIGLAGQYPPAHPPNQGRVALQQFLEGGGIALLCKAPQQFGIVFLQARPAQGTAAGNQCG